MTLQIHTQPFDRSAMECPSCRHFTANYNTKTGDWHCTRPECKAEYGGGFVCFQKKGGCGAKFKDGDPAITSQQTGRVPNPDMARIANPHYTPEPGRVDVRLETMVSRIKEAQDAGVDVPGADREPQGEWSLRTK